MKIFSLIIRTHLLANVTAINHMPDFFTKLLRHKAFRLRLIRQAAHGIHTPVAKERTGWAEIHTARTIAAPVVHHFIGWELYIRNQLA